MVIYLLSFTFFSLALFGLSIGLVTGRGGIRGTCGGLNNANGGGCGACGRSATDPKDCPRRPAS